MNAKSPLACSFIAILLAGCASTPAPDNNTKHDVSLDPRVQRAFDLIEKTASFKTYQATAMFRSEMFALRVDRDAVYVDINEQSPDHRTAQEYKVLPDGTVFLFDNETSNWKQQSDIRPTNP